MAVKVNSCCGCFTTRIGTIIIGSFNLLYSFLGIIAMATMLILILVVGSGFDAHAVLVVGYVFLGIGLLAAIAVFAMSLVLIRGVAYRRPRLVFYYLIYGTIATFLSLISTAIGIYNVGILVTAIIVFVLEVYFLVVVYSEYRNIVEEKEQEIDQVPPYSIENPNVQYSHEMK